MTKLSKRNRRRMHQGGMGDGFRVVRHVPHRVQRGLPQAPSLSPEARFRYPLDPLIAVLAFGGLAWLAASIVTAIRLLKAQRASGAQT